MTLAQAEWAEVRTRFDEIMDLPTRSRADYLIKLSLPPHIAEQLQALLKAATTSGVLDGGVPGLETDTLRTNFASLAQGTRVGAFEVDRLIGRGGTGEVYLAHRQDGGFAQTVALKLLRVEAAGHGRMFERERRLLAGLEHPGIARLIDGGTAPDGRPFMAMEYVEGVPIDLYCRQQGLGLDARLDLFGAICAAVSYAHAKLVVHRDLKPSNIQIDQAGHPRLLDFGIATLLDDTALLPATGNGAVAIGDPNTANGAGAVAIGADNTANGGGAVALGNGSRAEGGVAIGYQATASGLRSIALGAAGTVASSADTIALGANSTANAANAIALGRETSAGGVNSVALGAGSVAINDNTVSVGNTVLRRRVTNVASATQANDAVNYSQLTSVATVANAAQASALAANTQNTVQDNQIAAIQLLNTSQSSAISALQQVDIAYDNRLTLLEAGQANLFDLAATNRIEARQGIAAAVAMADAPFPSEPGRTSYAANGAVYRGEAAFSVSLMHRLDTESPFAITAGVSQSGGRNTAVRAGFAGEF